MHKNGLLRIIIWIIILFFIISGIVVFMNLKDKIIGTSNKNSDDSDNIEENDEDEGRIVGVEEIDYSQDGDLPEELLDGD